jgi:hypothetical protein
MLVVLISCSSDETPEVATTAVTDITQTGATSGGKISSNGGADIIARGVVWSTSQNPTIALTTKTSDGTGIGSFTSNISDLTPGTSYFVRAYATNSVGTSYGNEVNFTTGNIQLPVITTTAISDVTQTTAISGGNITSDGGGNITARGVVWSTSQNPTIALTTKTSNGTGAGSFTSNIADLTPGTSYFVRAYATNSVGTAYGNEVSFTTTTEDGGSGTYPPGSVFCNGTPTAVVDVTNPTTGKIWMDRNLGASQVATSSTHANSYGDLYQWGRRADGHQCRNSATTNTLSSTNQPAHGNFIKVNNQPYDWRSPHNNNLWQGVNGVNNPCPSGYRLPTDTEWTAERSSWSSQSSTGAFASPLKLPMAGNRLRSLATLANVHSYGLYWSSTVSSTDSRYLGFNSSIADTSPGSRATGQSVRCIKD